MIKELFIALFLVAPQADPRKPRQATKLNGFDHQEACAFAKKNGPPGSEIWFLSASGDPENLKLSYAKAPCPPPAPSSDRGGKS